MNRRRGWALSLVFSAAALFTATAQNSSTNAPPSGPVVYPSTNSADAAPPPAPAAAPVVTTPTASTPAAPTPSSSPPLPPDFSAGSGAPTAGQPPDDIADIRPPLFYLHSWFWLWVVLGILALAALAVLLWFWLKPERILTPKSAYDLALEKLEKARALLDDAQPEPYAVFVSETVRSYLGQRFQAPSTRRTTEEFLRQMQTDGATPLAEHRNLLQGFLEACDLVKFAHYQPTRAELEEVQERAVTFVRATNPAAAPAAANGRTP